MVTGGEVPLESETQTKHMVHAVVHAPSAHGRHQHHYLFFLFMHVYVYMNFMCVSLIISFYPIYTLYSSYTRTKIVLTLSSARLFTPRTIHERRDRPSLAYVL